MKEHQRKGEAYITSFSMGWTKSKEFEENYDRIFRKKVPHEFVVKSKGIFQWKECKNCGLDLSIQDTAKAYGLTIINLPEYCSGKSE